MRSIVLLSSGLDSTVNFCKALRESEVVLALTFDYGQRAAQKEISYSQTICQKYKTPHKVIQLEWLKDITQTALVNKEKNLPKLSEEELDDFKKTTQSAKDVWVPNRNGVFIEIAASFGESLEADSIVVGFNAEEGVAFPDNSIEYLYRINQALQLSTLKSPKVTCYTSHLTKVDIVRFGKELNAPFDLMWSCYEACDAMCGKCESCLRYFRAFRGA